jgi:hypothetical protein
MSMRGHYRAQALAALTEQVLPLANDDHAPSGIAVNRLRRV